MIKKDAVISFIFMDIINKFLVFKSLKKSYQFIVDDFGYKIIDEEFSSPLLFYIRYENENLKRIISVSIDLREAYFGITIWKASDGFTKDEDMLEFETILQKNGVSKGLLSLSGVFDAKVIHEINQKNAFLLKEYGSELIKGAEY